jgi:iron complex transport system substrate-binding protein
VTRIDGFNGIAIAIAVCASLLGAGKLDPGAARFEQIKPHPQPIEEIALPGGGRGIRDASGAIAPLRHYARIASISLVADHVLWELCEPERWVGVSALSKSSEHFGYRHTQRTAITSPTDLEAILALHPDLLLINHFGDPRYVERLRERGVVVFDLGEMRGMETLLPNMRAIGALLGKATQADALAHGFALRLQAVDAGLSHEPRPRALYLSAYGKQLYGGAAGTSYHDVLTAAGLIDAAAPRFRGWPALDAEQVLSLDPEIIVTKLGMSREICRFPGLGQARPCRGQGRIIEVDPELIDDPSLPMLQAAESLREQVYGRGKP